MRSGGQDSQEVSRNVVQESQLVLRRGHCLPAQGHAVFLQDLTWVCGEEAREARKSLERVFLACQACTGANVPVRTSARK